MAPSKKALPAKKDEKPITCWRAMMNERARKRAIKEKRYNASILLFIVSKKKERNKW